MGKVDVRRYSDGVLLIREADYQRLQAVVDAARVFSDHDDMMHDAFEALVNTWSERRKHEAIAMQAQFEALRDALAAYDAKAASAYEKGSE